MIDDLNQSIAEADANVCKFTKLTRECVRRVRDLGTLRPLEQRFNPKGVVYIDAQVDCILIMYFQFVRKLYKAKKERAVCEAKKDFYEAKLNPEWSYTDKYASRKSYYLSPIQEEEEEEEEDCCIALVNYY